MGSPAARRALRHNGPAPHEKLLGLDLRASLSRRTTDGPSLLGLERRVPEGRDPNVPTPTRVARSYSQPAQQLDDHHALKRELTVERYRPPARRRRL